MWLDTSALGDIVLGADPNIITVPYTSTNLTVDGDVSEGAWDIATDVSKVVIGATNNTTKFGCSGILPLFVRGYEGTG